MILPLLVPIKKLQDEVEAVRLALIKAKEQQWQKIRVSSGNKQLIFMIRARTVKDIRMSTLMEDTDNLASLFQLYSFCVRNMDSMDLYKSIREHAVGILIDEKMNFFIL